MKKSIFKIFTEQFLFLIFLIIISTKIGIAQTVVHFPTPLVTGENCSIAFIKSIHPSINGYPMLYGDEIAVFNSKNICCGARFWNGYDNIAIPVFGEDTVRGEPGMKPNEQFVFRVWSVMKQYEYNLVNVTYMQGNGLYMVNSLHALSSFEVVGTPPIKSAPILITPINSSYLVPVNTNFTWQKFVGSNLYQIQISKISDFSSIYFDNNQIQDTIISNLLEQNTFYFWRVRAQVNSTWSDWSDIWVFSTGDPLSDINYDLNSSNQIDLNIFPNPCQNKTNIFWTCESEIPRNIFLINSLGEKVLNFSDSNIKDKFENNFEIDLNLLNSGVYYCILETEKYKLVRKVVVIK